MANSEAGADLAGLAKDAVVWGFPMVMMGRYLTSAETEGLAFNQFFMNTEVANPKSDAIGPNIDTLNGRAWLDLDAGPMVIGVPATDDRYYCIQLQDLYTNTFAYLGRRTTGTEAGAFAITPPGFTGALPAGVTKVESTSNRVLILSRTLVRSSGDLAAVQQINKAFTLGPLSAYPGGRRPAQMYSGAIDQFQPANRRETRILPQHDMINTGAAFFYELDALVRRFPPLPDDAPNLARFAPLGLGVGAPLAAKRTPELDALFVAAVPAGLEVALGLLQSLWSDNGWSRRPNLGGFIHDPVKRAADCMYGPSTNISAESVFYNKRQGPDGVPLSGQNRYRLRFAPGQTPPVDAFWSLTLYDANYVLFENPLGRYGLNDRTEGMRFGADGSLELKIQADEPADGPSNWLPSPREGFQLVLRTYQPQEPILERSWKPPPLEISQ